MEHSNCELYRVCPKCIKNEDRWGTFMFILGAPVIFTFVIPVVPALISIVIQIKG
jgi:hypothetical protein